jgi:hypothetical protein
MTTHDLAQASAHTISHHRATQRFFNAEAEAAQRQLIGAKKNHEVRTGAPPSRAIHGVEIAAAH